MTNVRTYQVGKSHLIVRFGDIVSADAQVIVSSDDYYITMGGGVSAAIHQAGGEAIPLDAAKKVPAALGDVVVTTAGTLSAQYVFHAITIGPNPEALSPEAIIEHTTRRCMRLLDALQLTSIAFPAIGAGSAGFSYDAVAARMAEVIVDELSTRATPAQVWLYLLDRSGSMTELDFVQFFEEFARKAPRIGRKTVSEPPPPLTSEASTPDLVAETQEEYKRRRIHNVRRLLAELEDQRGKLEHGLIGLVGGDEQADEKRIRKALAGNQELRLQYMNELQTFVNEAGDTTTPPKERNASLKVFVSSTSLDLAPYREAARDAIARCDLSFRGMEHFGAATETPAKVIVEEVRRADVYVGLFGMRYGSVDPVTGLSMTELELREAETGKKPIRTYVIHDEVPVLAAHIEKDPEGLRKLEALKAHILKTYVAYRFRNPDDLQRQIEADLVKLKAQWRELAPQP